MAKEESDSQKKEKKENDESSSLMEEYDESSSLMEEYDESSSLIEEYNESDSLIESQYLALDSSVIQEHIDTEENIETSLVEKIDADEKQVKKRFDRYEILGTLGWGGMGIVYKAKDPLHDRILALKIMHASEQSPAEQKRFVREAKSTAKLDHPNIIKVHDIGYDQEQFFFTMDFVPGISLKDFLEDGQLNTAQAIKIAIEITRGISYAHDLGFIHRDLKPANIMIDKNRKPIIMDFGLVKVQDESVKLSKTGTVLGTLQYMPPEQLDGTSNVDERSDLYSLGATIYEMLTKKPPFESSSQMRLMYKILEEEAISPEKINGVLSKDLSKICLKAMAKKKENRYQNAEELVNALKDFLEQNKELEKEISFSNPEADSQSESFFDSEIIETMPDDALRNMPLLNKSLKLENLGSYDIIEEVGVGGMGKVYKAYAKEIERFVAIKVMLNDSEKQRTRFLSEAKVTAKLHHPNIVMLHDFGNFEGKSYIVMHYIEGDALKGALKKVTFSPRESLELVKIVALAMDYAHSNGIVHRDLKPANIIIVENTKIPIIVDFGLAKNIENLDDLTKTGDILGTPLYMAPEQAEGKSNISPLTDVYALGTILYEMLTERTSVKGDNPAMILYNIIHREVIPPRQHNSRLSPELEAICLKCLEKEPKHRYPSAKALAEDIERYFNGEIIYARPPGFFRRVIRKVKRYQTKILYVAIASMGVLSLVLGISLSKSATGKIKKFFIEKQQGKNTWLAVDQLEKKYGLKTHTVFHPRYKKSMTYNGFWLNKILKPIIKNMEDEAILRCTDGYNSSIPLKKLWDLDMFLAINEKGNPNKWTKILRGSHKVSPAPFYLVGRKKEDYTIFTWVYMLEGMELVPVRDKYKVSYPREVKPESEVMKGFNLFRLKCFACHSINLEGGGVGPELNIPKNITEYRSNEFLKVFIKNASAYRAKSLMYSFPKLSDKDLQAIIAYLTHMKKQKKNIK